MPSKQANNLDLSKLFQAVTNSMVENREPLNRADQYNHNHGDNMVEIFRVITEAMETKQGADPADQLEYASELLRKKSQTGSAQIYAEGLSHASQEFKGQSINADNAMTLINLLLGGQQAAPTQPSQPSGNLLGSLLSSFTGSQSTESQDGLDLNDLLNAGMSFMSSKQQGKDNVESIMGALVSATQSGQSPHRAESGALVAKTLMQVIGSMSGQ
jgi:hypothetical protein